MSPEEIHILGLSAPILLKMLIARKERILAGIYGEFKNGKQDNLMQLAAFCCVQDQINDIGSALRTHEQLEGKRHAASTSNRTDSDT
jgi:hypothetical protein